jgi:hypothetical protein
MQERRSARRRRPTYYLRVFDDNNDQLAGSLIDISSSGLMLASRKRFKQDESLRVRLSLPDALMGERTLVLNARNKWCHKELDSSIHDYFSAGFVFDNVDLDKAEMIKNSMRNFLFQD